MSKRRTKKTLAGGGRPGKKKTVGNAGERVPGGLGFGHTSHVRYAHAGRS